MKQEDKEFTDIALNAQLDTFFVFEPATGRALRWNRAFSSISGYTDCEIAMLPAPDSYYSPEDLKRAKALYRNVMHEGMGTIELELLCKDGKRIPTEYMVAVIRDEKQEPGYIIAIGRDITERRRIEQELRSREILFRTAIESFPADLFALDVNERYTLQNSMSRSLWGDIIGKCPSDIAPNARMLALWKENNRRVLTGETVRGEITAHVLGEERHYYNIISPIKDKEIISGILGINIDITERKQAEEAYSVLFNSSLQALVILQKERIVFVNPAAESLSQYSIEELLSMENPIQTLIHPEDLQAIMQRYERRSRGENVPPVFEYRIVQKSGKPRWVESQTAQIQYRGEPATHTVYIDITERKEIEKQLRQSEKMEALGQLAAGIAHDFNNQLSAILCFADILRHDIAGNPAMVEYCNNIIRSVDRASDLTSKLLAFSRKGNYIKSAVDVHRLIVDVTEMLRRTVDKRVKITQNLSACSSAVFGDSSQLQNALLNLGLNARDAMPEGGELMFSTQNIVLHEIKRGNMGQELPPGEYIRIAVSDTGIGIAEQDQGRIFEPFFTTKEIGKGTGMGLAAVNGTVLSHGGAIEVQSAPGKGAIFIIYLSTTEHDEQQERASGERMMTHGHGSILFVDDEELVCEVARVALESLGYNVKICRDGRQAVECFRSSPDAFDLVILDMIMPGLNGKEAFEEMRRMRSDVKVLILSDYSAESDPRKIVDAGASGFIKKPFTRSTLAEKVARILGHAD